MSEQDHKPPLATPQEVLSFWVEGLTPADWYKVDATLDQRIRDGFSATWAAAEAGDLAHWVDGPQGALAFLIVTDQMSRNMFRGEARAFATDKLGLAAAKYAIDKGWDLRFEGPERQFFYLPLMHSECLADQDRCVRLISERLTDAGNLRHARAHREIIRQFGRFPYRNAALDRRPTEAEEKFLVDGGYAMALNGLDVAA